MFRGTLRGEGLRNLDALQTNKKIQKPGLGSITHRSMFVVFGLLQDFKAQQNHHILQGFKLSAGLHA